MFLPVGDAEEKEAEASAKIMFKNLRLCEMTPGLIVEIVEIFFVGFRFSFTKTYNDHTVSVM